MKSGLPNLIGAAPHFSAGMYRPDRPTGRPIDDIGAKPPPPEERAALGTYNDPARDPRTAANLAAKEEALKPRRWTPPHA